MEQGEDEGGRGQVWCERLLGHPIVSRRQFYPRRDDEPLPPQFALAVPTTYNTPARAVQKVEEKGEEPTLPSLSCYYYTSPNKHPNKKTVVHFHGNGELVSSYVRAPAVAGIPSLYGCLREMGVDVLFVEYRGYGSSGGEVHMAAMLDDVSAVLNTLAVPAGDVVVFGRSMGSVFTIEATARFPDLCGIIVESGLSDLYPFMVQRMTPADLLGLYDAIVEASSGGSEPPLGDSEEEKGDVVRSSLRTACDRVLALDRKWQAYRGNVLLLHCEDDQALPPSEANANYERAWASWREAGQPVDPSARPDAAPQKAAERQDTHEPEARVSDEESEVVVVADDTADGGQRRVMKRKVLFCAGGHQHIWPMNWPRYRDEVARFLGQCGHQVADHFDDATATARRPVDSHAQASTQKKKKKEEEKKTGGCLLA